MSSSSSLARSGITMPLFLTFALLSAVGPLSIDMYLPGFTVMAEDLGTSASSIQLTLTSFLFGLASGQLVIGTLSDRYGRRRPLLISLAICAVAGIGVAVAPTIEVLIALRFVQGFTGAAGVVISQSVIRDLTEGRTAVRAFSLLATIRSVAPVIAPLLGGVLLPLVGWRGILGVLAGMTVLMVIAAVVQIPESLSPEKRSSGGFGELLGAVRQLARNRAYVGYVLMTAFTFGALFAWVSASPFVLQNVFGLSTGEFSVAFTVNAMGMMIGSGANVQLVTRFAPESILFVAQASFLTISAVLTITVLTGVATLFTFLPLTFLLLVSAGLMIGNAVALAMTAVTVAVGSAAAVLGALQFSFGAVISPIVGLGGEDTAVPMVLVMLACAILAFLALQLARRTPLDQAPASGQSTSTQQGAPANDG